MTHSDITGQNLHLKLPMINFYLLMQSKLCVKKMQVLFAASLLKTNQALHEAVMSAMSNKATVRECIEAIEKAAA